MSLAPRVTPLIVVGLLLGSSLSLGCGDNTNTPIEDFAADCSVCINGIPMGPSASQESCTAWGTMFDCGSIVLTNEGVCGGPDEPSATCSVDDCSSEPTGCVEDE